MLEPEQWSPRPGRLSCFVFSADSWRVLLRPCEGPASASAGSMAPCRLAWNFALCLVPAVWHPPSTDLPQGDSQEGLFWEHRGRPGGAGGPGPCCLGARGTFGTRVGPGWPNGGSSLSCRGRLLSMWPGTAALMTSCGLDTFFWSCGWHFPRPPCAQVDPSLRGLCTGLGRGSLRRLPTLSTVFLRNFSGLSS